MDNTYEKRKQEPVGKGKDRGSRKGEEMKGDEGTLYNSAGCMDVLKAAVIRLGTGPGSKSAAGFPVVDSGSSFLLREGVGGNWVGKSGGSN